MPYWNGRVKAFYFDSFAKKALTGKAGRGILLSYKENDMAKRTQAPVATKTTPFQLLQWKHAIKLEKLGMRISRGRKVTPHAARFFGLKPRAKADDVLEMVEAALNACTGAGAAMTQVIEFEDGWNG
jgi:hypothetical protein